MPLDPRIGLAFQPTQYFDTSGLVAIAALQDKRRAANEQWMMDLADQSLQAGVAARESAVGTDEQRDNVARAARNKIWENAKNSGLISQHGIDENRYNKAIGAPWDHNLAMFRVYGSDKAAGMIQEQQSAKTYTPYGADQAPAIGPGVSPGQIMEHREPPVQGIDTSTLPLSDVSKPLQVQALAPREPPFQTQELEPEKGHVEPPPPTVTEKEDMPKPPQPPQPGEQPVGRVEGKPDVYGKSEDVSAEAFSNDLWKRAGHASREAEKQRKLGTAASKARAKELEEDADKYRQRALAVERQELAEARETRLAAAKNGDQDIRPEDAEFVAKQVWAGDKSAMTGWARSQKNKAMIQKAITEYGKKIGKRPEDLVAKEAEFKAIEQAERSIGARAGSVELGIQTVKRFAPLVAAASADLKRTNVRSINDLYNSILSGTASPELRRLSAQINGFINIYARTVGGGVPHVDDKQHAREVLDRGFSHGDIMASLEALTQEMEAEQGAVPEAIHEITAPVRGTARGEGPTRRSEDEEKSGRFPKAKSMAPNLGVPPKEGRKVGQVYDTPKGKLKWTGTGWIQP